MADNNGGLLKHPHLLAHELRTPLAVILGYVSMVRNGDLIGDNAVAALDIALQQGRRLNRAITDVASEAQALNGSRAPHD